MRIELSGKTSIADYMVVATGTNSRQLAAMADHLVEKLKAKGRTHVPVEGRQQGDWVLVDAGDVIVHLFRPEARAHYALEKMWKAEFAEDAPAPRPAAAQPVASQPAAPATDAPATDAPATDVPATGARKPAARAPKAAGTRRAGTRRASAKAATSSADGDA